MKKSMLKSSAGILLMCMAMGELAAGFIGYPALLDYCWQRTDWWAAYLPLVMLINTLALTVLAVYCGVKLMHDNVFLTNEQNNWLNRWFEKRKYGYCKSDFIIKKEGG